MHDFLHISNVSRLPSSVQPSVLAAANGSFQDLEKVCAIVSSPDLREFPEDTTILLCFLPVLYIHLDPARIPTAEDVDHGLSVTTAIPAVAAASLALKATCEIAELPIFPDEIGLNLWLRVWPWMQFMDTYWEVLRTFDPKKKMQVALRNWALVQTLRGCGEETRAVIAAQYGLRFMAARDWTAVLLDGSVVEDRDVLEHASRIINNIAQDLKVPEHFQEVVDGADGDLERLASAMIRHTSLIVACPNKDLRFRASLLIPSPLVGSHKQEKFVSLLLSRGIVRNLVLITRILDGPKDGVHPLTAKEADSGPKENSLFTLVKYFRVAPGYPWIAEAIRAGFLSMIISFALQNIDFRMQMNLQTILRTILPLNLVSPSVITEMRRALVGVEEYSCQPEFRHSPLFADWEVLVDFANERYRILDKWEATRGSSLKACDNVKCGKIELKNKFKRCAGCLSANYCSVDCQSDDWQDGHRMVCDDLRAVRSRHPDIVHPRERSFLRALMHHDYEEQKIDLAVQQIWHMRRNSPDQDYVVVFDYTRGPSPWVINIQPRKGNLSPRPYLDAALPMLWEKHARSKGRIMMHLALVLEGAEIQPRVFPLRAASGAFQAGLEAIARTSTGQDKQSVRRLLAELDGRVDLTQIH